MTSAPRNHSRSVSGDVSLSVTMRTPGDDFDLVAGFLITEGIVRGAAEIAAMRMCPDADAASGELNIVEVTAHRCRCVTRPDAARVLHDLVLWHVRQGEHRGGAHEVGIRRGGGSPARLARAAARLPAVQRSAQRQFARTGGLHAAALFDAEGALAVSARGCRPAQRLRQGDRMGRDHGDCSRCGRT